MTHPVQHIYVQHIGTRLRQKRQALDMSIADVAKLTHIQPTYLRHIESLNVQELPSIGYVLGFVRSYARALGLDGENAVADYKADVQVPENLGMRDRPHFVPKRKISLPSGFVPALMTLGFSVMLASWYGLQTQTNAAVTDVVTSYEAALEDVQAAPVMDEDLITLRALAPSWVQVKDKSGNILISRIFVAGEMWQGSRKNIYFVSVRDAGAITLYNGEDKHGPLGFKGEVKTDMLVSADFVR